MRRVCAWCERDMGAADSSRLSDTDISHGICSKCLDNFTFQKGVPVQDYLDSIPLPVMLIEVAADHYTITRSANKALCGMLGKELWNVAQHLLGNVFECAHARLPEGCGRTLHCSGCAIRRSVMKTHTTGEPQLRVPATLKRGLPGENLSLSLLITTVKAGDSVMLRIEQAEG